VRVALLTIQSGAPSPPFCDGSGPAITSHVPSTSPDKAKREAERSSRDLAPTSERAAFRSSGGSRDPSASPMTDPDRFDRCLSHWQPGYSVVKPDVIIPRSVCASSDFEL